MQYVTVKTSLDLTKHRPRIQSKRVWKRNLFSAWFGS